MSDNDYQPPRVWTWDKESGGKFASINRPVAGPRYEAELPVGEHAYQLYSPVSYTHLTLPTICSV